MRAIPEEFRSAPGASLAPAGSLAPQQNDRIGKGSVLGNWYFGVDLGIGKGSVL
jgi:hypothetical protein